MARKNQPAEITMFQISEVQESPAFTDRWSFLALRAADDDDDNPDSLTDSDLVCITDQKAPRGGLNSHHGFVELGSLAITKLRQTRTIDFYAWTRPPELEKSKSKPKKKRDPLRLARYYQ